MLKMKKIGFNLIISFLTMSSLSAMDAPQNKASPSSRPSHPEILKTPMVPLQVIKEEIKKNKANIEAYASNLYTRHSQPTADHSSQPDHYTYHFEWNQFDITIQFNDSSIMKFFESLDQFKAGIGDFLKKDDINIKDLFLTRRNKQGEATGGEYVSVTYDYDPLNYLFDVKLNIPSGYDNCTIGEKESRKGTGSSWVIDTWHKSPKDPAAPLIQCKLSSEGFNKRTLKGLSLDKIVTDFRAGKTPIEALQSIPQDLQSKLPPDILEKLLKRENHPKEAK